MPGEQKGIYMSPNAVHLAENPVALPRSNTLARDVARRQAKRPHHRALFISPHLDDAVFSCGGKMQALAQEGPVLVINVFTGFPAEISAGPVVLGPERHAEEASASRLLGFASISLGETDAYLRRRAYRSLKRLFGEPVPEDKEYLAHLTRRLAQVTNTCSFDELYVPLGVGWHVDHVLCHLAARNLGATEQTVFYEEAPYCYIPNAVEYRLYEIGQCPELPPRRSLVSEWRETRAHYMQSAVIQNIRPAPVRFAAGLGASWHLLQVMRRKRLEAKTAYRCRKLVSVPFDISMRLEKKVEAMAAYTSQFNALFLDRERCVDLQREYSGRILANALPVERYWITREAAPAPRSLDIQAACPAQPGHASLPPLRICFVSDDFHPARTGAGMVAQREALELSRRGHTVSVITTRRWGEPKEESWQGLRIHRTGTAKVFGYHLAFPRRRTLRRILEAGDFDIIHSHYLGYLMMTALDAASGLPARRIYSYHMPVELLTQAVPMKPFRRTIGRLHVNYCSRFDLILAPSTKMIERIAAHGITARTEYLSNPIGFTDIAEPRELECQDAFTVLFVGRLSPEKNLPYLLKAFAGVARREPSAALSIVGDGPERSKLVRLAHELGVQNRAKFHGHVRNDLLEPHYSAARVFVLPSLTEVQPLVALEAMRFGKPVIVTDRIAAARELIDDGMNGFVVDADSPEDLCARMLQLSRAPRLARAMGRQGFERSKAFTLEAVVDRLEQFYRGCLA